MEAAEELRVALEINVPNEVIETVAERVATRLGEHLGPEPEPWVGVERAADHLACPKSRIYDLVSARRIPHQRDGSRLLFRRSDLDAWVTRGGGKRR
jgi:excisionase family DNA binding protein